MARGDQARPLLAQRSRPPTCPNRARQLDDRHVEATFLADRWLTQGIGLPLGRSPAGFPLRYAELEIALTTKSRKHELHEEGLQNTRNHAKQEEQIVCEFCGFCGFCV